eukprot:gene4397-4650_t
MLRGRSTLSKGAQHEAPQGRMIAVCTARNSGGRVAQSVVPIVQQQRICQVTAQAQPTRFKRPMAAATQAQKSSSSVIPDAEKVSVLFVCLGNICRSPTAEAMFRSVVDKAGLADCFDIDSCGTGGGSSNWYLPGGFSYHQGDPSDSRMTAAAIKRGVKLTSTSRPLQPADLSRFDYIIGMDPRNVRDILKAASYWAGNDSQLPALDEVRAKTSLMTEYCTQNKAANEVPDPYYGGSAGFEMAQKQAEAQQSALESLRATTPDTAADGAAPDAKKQKSE